MGNEIILNAYGVAFGISVLLCIGWIAIYILGWIWAWTWSWIDDSDCPERNPIIDRVMKIMGFKVANASRCWRYIGIVDEWGVQSDGAIGFFAPLLILAFTPFAIVLYQFTLAIFCLYLIARLARFARRNKKLFDKHIKDPSAHK